MQEINNYKLHIGLLAAMPEEIGITKEHLKRIRKYNYGDLEIYSGIWQREDTKEEVLVSIAWSGWGKVSAARATIRIISNEMGKGIDYFIFTGLAGAVKENLKPFDIVISDAVVHHDMDARPLFKKYVIPSLKRAKLEPDQKINKNIFNCLTELKSRDLNNNFGNVYEGLIASGDIFISDRTKLLNLQKDFPDLYAVEMEGAAFAQVCYQENIKWTIVRVISDKADGTAANDFSVFLEKYKSISWQLIENILSSI